MPLISRNFNKGNIKRSNLVRQLCFKNGLLKLIKKDVKAGKQNKKSLPKKSGESSMEILKVVK